MPLANTVTLVISTKTPWQQGVFTSIHPNILLDTHEFILCTHPQENYPMLADT
jgi:hypothetical protein